MKKRSVDNTISAEVLAAFLDGNATAQESQAIIDAMSNDACLREVMRISQAVDAELGVLSSDIELLPMTAMAATCEEGNLCTLECEEYLLKRFGVECDRMQMLEKAMQNGWQKDGGTALHNVGRHAESYGLIATRQYKCTVADIVSALDAGEGVIVAVDGGELQGDRVTEMREDLFVGLIPDHTVVVLRCDEEQGTITVYDPNSCCEEDTYPLRQFENAWNDSKNYLVTITLKEMKTYVPKPIDLSDVELSEDLNELREAIAENAHEVWAEGRQKEGWTYGPRRDDVLKQTPDMVAYSQLTDSEKQYDRNMAMNTLKLVKKLGYDLVKREETELYKELIEQLRSAKVDILCPCCLAKGVKTPVLHHDIFCRECGHKLNIDWSLHE